MVIKKILGNGSNVSRSPAIPRAPRSTRKRNLRKKSIEGGQLCAFELLATVAGKLLEESECSSAASSAAVGFDQYGNGKDGIKKEPLDEDKLMGGENDDQGSSEGSVYFSGIQKGSCKGKCKAVSDGTGEHVSHIASSVCSEKVDPDSKLVNLKNNGEFVKLSSKIVRDFPFGGESDDNNVGNEVTRKVDINEGAFGDLTMANKSRESSDSRGISKMPFLSDPVSKDSFLKDVSDVKIGSKDDDEILSRCSQPNNFRKILKSPIGDHRFRKLQSSKYWKTAPKLWDCEVTNSGGGAAKQFYDNKRPYYEIDRSQRDTPFKKRKLFERSSIVTHDGGISSESVSNSPEKSRDDDNNALTENLQEGKAKLPCGFSRQNSCNSRNSQVRLSIKSFKVPELFIEVPENATVGSLKRTVLEAVTSILGDGLRVGVLLQGKKIRDDNRTLLQTGISQNNNDMDTVGFILEPNSPIRPSPPISPKDPSASLLSDSPKFANRSQVNLKEEMFLLGSLDKPSVTDSNSPAASSKDLVLSPTMELAENNVSDYKALVPVPEASMEALAMLPANPKSKHSEIGQRRTRRPFSVTEVEALVHAVEKLGTGRWRDVKLCSFEKANHRTYVDLKDKWKTLVHTARISPQQRRGEPVPQELLDRVLATQAYWSEHQAKQHGGAKHNTIIPKLTDSVA